MCCDALAPSARSPRPNQRFKREFINLLLPASTTRPCVAQDVRILIREKAENRTFSATRAIPARKMVTPRPARLVD
jgi:hypothetical protein